MSVIYKPVIILKMLLEGEELYYGDNQICLSSNYDLCFKSMDKKGREVLTPVKESKLCEFIKWCCNLPDNDFEVIVKSGVLNQMMNTKDKFIVN